MDAIAQKTTTEYNTVIPEWLAQYIDIANDPNQSDADAQLIADAFQFAYQWHEGQYRRSGEPYIAHPIAVAGLIRSLGGGSAMIAAGFLHDIIEDTETTGDELEERFGEQVRHLVEGVTKLSKFNFSSKTEHQAENFRRMFLAMAKDIRVIIVKLADRLHNMRTLEHLKPEKQKQISLETREIFAPLANRLGIGQFKWELEDLAFKYLEPEAFQEIRELVADRRADREARIENVIQILHKRFDEAGIEVEELKGRPKHLYGIYQKMQQQQKAFEEIYDLAGVRAILKTREDCYRALAVIHDAFKPIPGRFKDYIGLPKPNQYQSLHTTVIGTYGKPIEMQIRTIEMHHIAEYGIAAHWLYKESGGASDFQPTQEDDKFTWLRQLLEWQNDLKDAKEYIDSIRDNLFEDDVFVFTPQGDVVALARGATPVDFAYHIHTEIGNHMKGARVNGRWTVLDTPLQNGDIVEIITSKNSHPSLDWLNFVVTPSARNRIRQWYKRSHREENINRGRSMLEKAVGKAGFDALLKSDRMQRVAERCNHQTVEDLLAAIGYGEVTTNSVASKLREESLNEEQVEKTETPSDLDEETVQSLPTTASKSSSPPKGGESAIAGVEGLMYHRAGCCSPLPGEPIIGLVTRTKGVTIHCQDCSNVENADSDRVIPVDWNSPNNSGKNRTPTYTVELEVEVIDRVGVFRDILARLSDQHINVSNASVKTGKDKPALITLAIEVKDHQQLQHSCNQIKQMSDVLKLRRVFQGEL
ncbi:MAG: (p)ppGpp synthetase [Cyanobacteria bacterium SW_9_44_58]|nr:MAG: (p)ppGpp synthetase [Cyanobacteria bacterium SW_9_44_58]